MMYSSYHPEEQQPREAVDDASDDFRTAGLVFLVGLGVLIAALAVVLLVAAAGRPL